LPIRTIIAIINTPSYWKKYNSNILSSQILSLITII
jgi:hypothetical protein